MTASEILADNLRRLMQGQKSLDWAGDAVTSYHVDQALDGAPTVLVNDLQSIASAAGVEPWQLLAPLCGRAEMEPPAESTEATDAARYRWLRDHNAQIIYPSAYGYQVRWVSGIDLMHGPTRDTYDAAVDAAREAGK